MNWILFEMSFSFKVFYLHICKIFFHTFTMDKNEEGDKSLVMIFMTSYVVMSMWICIFLILQF